MKISYYWLIKYLNTELSVKQICDMLTDSGLEVESCQEINSLDRIFDRVVLGKIIYFQLHPYAINLNILQVDIGKDHILQIICEYKNISKGKKVIIANIGDYSLYKTVKKKIERITYNGIISNGLLCLSKNIGFQDSKILFIYNDKLPGTPAKEYIKIRKDYCIEIEFTINRVDAMSHWGVAREIFFILKARKYAALLNKPSVENFQSAVNFNNLLISINETKKCYRFCGCIISGVTIASSPIWMQNRLRSIGLHINNNVIDIINFVMHEFGQPLNALDVEDIDGKEIHIKTLHENIFLKILINLEVKISSKELMICDSKKPLGLAGIFCSNIQGTTKNIFLESTYFEPVNIRKSVKKHGINSYSSFFF